MSSLCDDRVHLCLHHGEASQRNQRTPAFVPPSECRSFFCLFSCGFSPFWKKEQKHSSATSFFRQAEWSSNVAKCLFSKALLRSMQTKEQKLLSILRQNKTNPSCLFLCCTATLLLPRVFVYPEVWIPERRQPETLDLWNIWLKWRTGSADCSTGLGGLRLVKQQGSSRGISSSWSEFTSSSWFLIGKTYVP